MPLPSIFQDHSFKRLVQGAAVGAVAAMIIGFNWGGWSLDCTAEKRADKASRSAVVAVLATICVDKFQQAANATAIVPRSLFPLQARHAEGRGGSLNKS